MMLQYLTTREPDDSMLEVAIASMKAAKAGPARYRENLDPNVYVYGAKEKKPEPKQETADEVSAEEETPTQGEQKDGASA